MIRFYCIYDRELKQLTSCLQTQCWPLTVCVCASIFVCRQSGWRPKLALRYHLLFHTLQGRDTLNWIQNVCVFVCVWERCTIHLSKPAYAENQSWRIMTFAIKTLFIKPKDSYIQLVSVCKCWYIIKSENKLLTLKPNVLFLCYVSVGYLRVKPHLESLSSLPQTFLNWLLSFLFCHWARLPPAEYLCP